MSENKKTSDNIFFSVMEKDCDDKSELDLTEMLNEIYKSDFTDENDEGDEYSLIEGYTIGEVIEKIAKSKVKDYKSLTNKTLFKFMDMIDM